MLVFMHPHELFHRSILVGGAFVIVDSSSPRIISEQSERWKVTWMMAVPNGGDDDLSGETTQHCPDLHSLRLLESGGAYVSACDRCANGGLLSGRVYSRLGVHRGDRGRFGQSLSSTVRCHGFSHSRLPSKIVDEDGEPLPIGEVGEPSDLRTSRGFYLHWST